MSTLSDDTQLFDSILAKKQDELFDTTTQKQIDLGAVPYRSLDLSNVPYNTVDLSNVEDEQVVINNPREFPYYLHDATVQTGLGYLVNTAGSLVSGGGTLLNSVLSFPNIIANAVGGEESAMNVNMLDFFDILGDHAQSFTDKFHNPLLTEKFHKDATRAYRDNSGAVDVLIGLGGSIVNNPAALPQVFGQSFATMAAMAKGGSALAMAYAGVFGDRAQQSIDRHKKTHNGLEPDGDDLRNIMIAAGVSAAIETIESKFLFGKLGNVAKAVKSKQTLLGTARNVGKGSTAESVQEYSAEYLTELSGRGDTVTGLLDPALLETPAVNATIGAGVGGGVKAVSGISGGVKTAASKTLDKASKAIDKAIETSTTKRQEKAVASNDFITAAEAAIEKDTSKFTTFEEHKDNLSSVLDLIDKANAGIDATAEGSSKDVDRILELSSKVKILTDIALAVKSAETTGLTPKQAEEVINNSKDVSAEVSEAAVATVVNTLKAGGDVETKTLSSIKGNIFFNDLSTEDKTVVKTYEEARQQATSVGEVNKDIVEGDPVKGFLGVKQYKQKVASAIQSQNFKALVKTMQALVSFRDSQVYKLEHPPKGYKQHAAAFEKQLRSEIALIDKHIELFDAQAKASFNKSPLANIAPSKPSEQTDKQSQAKPEKSAETASKEPESSDTEYNKKYDALLKKIEGIKYPKLKAHVTSQLSQVTPQNIDEFNSLIDAWVKERDDKAKPKTKAEPKKTETKVKAEKAVSTPLESTGTKEVVTPKKYRLFPNKDIYANADQTTAIDSLKNWWSNLTTNRIFILSGRGGTGKTTVISKAIREMGVPASEVQFALPTHKAKQVIKNSAKEFSNFSTIASLLGLVPSKKEGEDFKQDLMLYENSVERLRTEGVKLIVVDEASMTLLSTVESLLDLAEEIHARIIFMGDNVQLPPVDKKGDPNKLGISPVFSKLTGFSNPLSADVDSSNTASLYQRMRQQGDSPILQVTDILADAVEYVYSTIREGAKFIRGKRNPNIIFDGKDSKTAQGTVLYKSGHINPIIDEFVEEHLEDQFNVKWINYNNAAHQSSKNIRARIRAKLFPNDPHAADVEKYPFLVDEHLMIGDIASTYKNGEVSATSLHNGDEVVVTGETRQTYIDIPKTVGSGTYIGIPVDLLPVSIDSKNYDIIIGNKNTKKALIKQFSANQKRYPGIADSIIRGLTEGLGPAYIINTHKAQGSTYKTVYVDYSNITGTTGSPVWVDTLRSLYVATSRPTDKLVMVGNKLELGVGKTVNEIVGDTSKTKREKEKVITKPAGEKSTVRVGDKEVEVTLTEKIDDYGSLAVTTNGKITLRKGITKAEVMAHITGKTDSLVSRQKNVTTQYLLDKFNINLPGILNALPIETLLEFIVAHEVGHTKQKNLTEKYLSVTSQAIAKSFNLEDASNKYLADSAIKLEAGAHRYALQELKLLTNTKPPVVSKFVDELSQIDTSKFVIPNPSVYKKDAKLSAFVGISKTRYSTLIVKSDNILRALKQMVEEGCV